MDETTAHSGVAEKRPVHIEVYRDWCKGCGICAAFCPKKVLAIDESGHSYAKNPEACIRCGMCEMRCPDFAISVEQEEGKTMGGPH